MKLALPSLHSALSKKQDSVSIAQAPRKGPASHIRVSWESRSSTMDGCCTELEETLICILT